MGLPTPTIQSRFLERNKQSYKVGQKLSDRQCVELRLAWKADMLGLRGQQLVFIDESLFNSTTSWRKKAWSAIGQPTRYHYDISRRKSWSILPAYTVDGYLQCTSIKEGYFNADEFFNWVQNSLLPVCRPGSVIIIDNNNTHVNARIERAITAAGFQVKYLPPYSPDFNPIELTFSVLKAWIKR